MEGLNLIICNHNYTLYFAGVSWVGWIISNILKKNIVKITGSRGFIHFVVVSWFCEVIARLLRGA